MSYMNTVSIKAGQIWTLGVGRRNKKLQFTITGNFVLLL